MPYYKVIEELGFAEAVIATGLTQDAAAQLCADLNDAWEGEHAPEDPDKYDAWREAGNDPPYWWTEDVK